jgi:thiamine-monophosphate kinase
MRESELLHHIAQQAADMAVAWPVVLIGPGDDCAHVRAAPEGTLLTVDQVIEGRHFVGPLRERATPIDLVARKAVARSVSDIAAMAGTPSWALATAALPSDWPQELATELFDRMHHWARVLGCPLVGGDIATTPAGTPVVLTTTIGGTPHPTRGPVRRSTASVGDHIWVTGRLGGSFASGRHLTFEPRVHEATALAGLLGERLHAMIDLSDGLGRDAARVGAASGVVLRIDGSRVPLHDDAHSPHEGEDYELLFTAAADAALPAHIAGTTLTRLGVVTPATLGGAGCVVVLADGTAQDGRDLGWDHT